MAGEGCKAMLTLGQVIEALTGGRTDGELLPITAVVVDSRLVTPGALFVALPGERTDGHNFVGEAFAKGAIAALIQREPGGESRGNFVTLDLRDPVGVGAALAAAGHRPICLRVADTLQALQKLAGYWRRRFRPRVVGVTGSVGKTTTKELMAAVLGVRYCTFKSEGNLNNEVGLPLMLLRIGGAHEYVVLEMGFYRPGEIKLLCDLACPQVGVVTNVYPVHLERAGTLENIVLGKGELVEALPPAPEGIAILNADDPLVLSMRDRTRARVFTYGLDSAADLWADNIESLGLDGVRFDFHYEGMVMRRVRVPMLGRHSVHTALRAAAVGLVEGLSWPDIIAGLQSSEAAQIRLVAVDGPGGSLILDDTYNASPESVIAALNLLNELDGRRIAVLGDMLELGAYETDGHCLVGIRAAAVVRLLVTVGPRARLIADAARGAGMPSTAVVEVPDAAAAAEYLRGRIGAGDVVLLKGSRSIQLEQVISLLDAAPADD